MIWLVIVALAAIAAARCCVPLLRASAAPRRSRADYDLAVYRDQLAELERDRRAASLSEVEAKAARAEIARRMLATERDDAGATAAPGRARSFAMAMAVAAPSWRSHSMSRPARRRFPVCRSRNAMPAGRTREARAAS